MSKTDIVHETTHCSKDAERGQTILVTEFGRPALEEEEDAWKRHLYQLSVGG